MHLPWLQLSHLGHEFTQRVALKQVAVVEQQVVWHFGAGRLDQGNRPRQPVLLGGLVLVVVVTQQVHVHVGGLQDAQFELSAPARRGAAQCQQAAKDQAQLHAGTP